QRLGLAAALVRAPALVMLDEPTAGLDPAGVRDARALVRSLARDGAAVLLSTHVMAEVDEVCDAVTIMSTGRVVWDGDIGRVWRAELSKLRTQLAVRVLAAVCLLGPVAFVAVIHAADVTPTDTLFGRWVHDTGFAAPLVVLGFAGAWGFPVLAGVVGGDLFS